MTFYNFWQGPLFRVILRGAFVLLVILCMSGKGADLCNAKDVALIIGVSHYDQHPDYNLLFVQKDVLEMYTVLKNAGFKVHSLCEQDTGIKGTMLPTKGNIESKLKTILSPDYCSSDDVVLVYFSSHGRRGTNDDNRTLLVAKDSNVNNEDSCVSAQDIRNMLDACPSKKTILILDACYSGGTRSAAKDHMKSFVESGTTNVITFASCKIDQTSKQWKKKEMSVFTYWVREGLKGYADSDNDDKITTGELFNYIEKYLAQTKIESLHGILMSHDQTPVIVGSKNLQHFHLTSPSPRKLHEILDDMAEQILTRMYLQEIKSLQFSKFQANAGNETKSGRDENALKSITDDSSRDLERRLYEKSKNMGISIVSAPNQGEASLTNMIFNPETVDGNLVYTLTSTLNVPTNPNAKSSIRARVQAGQTGETVNPSACTTPANLPSANTSYGAANTSYGGVDTSNRPVRIQPQEPSFIAPDIRIEVKDATGKFIPRPIEVINGNPWVALDPGEIYRIIIEPHKLPPNGLGLRLLVDGYNTLPQYMPYVNKPDVVSKFIVSGSDEDENETNQENTNQSTSNQNTSNQSTSNQNTSTQSASNQENNQALPSIPESAVEVVRPFTRLDNARYWIMDTEGWYSFDGFYHDIGANAAYDSFEVARTADHLKPGEYNDQIGLITCALYYLVPSRKPGTDVMTVPGPRHPFPVFVADGLELGNQLFFFQLNYVSSAALREYKESNSRQ